jgi:antitoxin HicB
MSELIYYATITVDKGGHYLIKFPDLPGAATDGTSREEALDEAADCLAEAVAGYLTRRQPVPEPVASGDVAIPLDPLLAAKAGLNNAMLAAGISRTMLADRLGVDEKAVRRLLDPRHQSHIRSVLRAASLLGLRAHVGFEMTPEYGAAFAH